MHETFRETDKAISWFLSGLIGPLGNEEVEVIRIEPHKVIRVFCRMQQVGGLLRQYCRSYKNASVHLHPDNKYGFVGEIRCHGNHDHHKADRPRVIVQRAGVRNEELIDAPS
jgi:hypothetical protein